MATTRNISKIMRSLANDPAFVKDIERALFVAGQRVQVEAQLSITRGSVSGKNHVSSAPGEPPNNDTGVLASNIETFKAGRMRVEVKSQAPYAAALEFGTARMAPRPYMGPAARKVIPEMRPLITKATEKAVARAIAKGGGRAGS